MRVISSFVVLSLTAAVELYGACGVERWSIKTGTDSQASSVNLGTYVSSTIYNFHQSAKPASLPATSRLSPRETTQYQLSGTLIKYSREADSDYHLVVKDSAGRTMIIELPATSCVGAGSPFGTGISRARSQFDARFTATTTMKTTNTPVTIRGIGFWDYIHGQTGVAPNGIEIHPVTNITFGTTVASMAASEGAVEAGVESAPTAVEVPFEPAAEVVLPADFVRDDDGGRVHVYRGGDAIGDALFHGGSVIEDPSVRILFAGNWSDNDMRPITSLARRINNDQRVQELDRYGVRTFGFRTSAGRLPLDGKELIDLDIQRALMNEVEAGRIQHVDPDAIYVVVLAPGTNATVGQTTDWLSYHSQFHPNELPMRYVVVRGGTDRDAQRDAIFGSLTRALVNPGGDGWF